jgi:signal transduction histidine kinase/DNA-binding response OmpR family regulator
MIRIFRYNLLLILVFYSLHALSQQNEQVLYKIGFSQCNTNDSWREAMLREMRTELLLYPQIELIVTDAEGNNQKQIQDINQLIEQKIDLLIVSPNESAPVTPIVEKVFKMGTPVIVIDRKIISQNFTAFIGANNYLIGQQAGKYAVKLLKEKGNILEIMGLPGSSPAIERHNGFVDIVKNYPDIKIIHSKSGKWNWTGGVEVMTEALEKKLNIHLVFAHNDFMASGAFSVLNKLPNHDSIYFLGIDGLAGKEGGIEYVINKQLNATFLYPTGGDMAIQTAWQILHNKPFKKENILQTVVIDSSNAEVLKIQTNQIQSLQYKIDKQKTTVEEQDIRYRNQQFFFNLTLIFLGLIIILTILFFRAFRLKKIANLKLEAQKKEIEKQNLEIISHRDRLLEISKQLEEATQTKLLFFTNISHEFRTPLTLIIGPLDNLINSGGFSASQLEVFKLMRRNAVRLLNLINQLMDFRKVENAKMKLSAKWQDIVPLLTEVNEAFEQLALEKRIALTLTCDKTESYLYFEKDKMDKILFNLLSNAFKFTPTGGKISISLLHHPFLATLQSESIEIRIEDTGKGIAQENLNKIFENFYQVEQTEYVPGTGLGLPLTKSLVELHHGQIEVESELGSGSVFKIYFPKGNQHLAPNEICDHSSDTDAISHQIKSKPEETDIMPSLNLNNFNTPEDDSQNETSVSILIVEDNADVRAYVKSCFTERYTIIEASNGKEALALIEETEPDLIISDVMMPEMDGLELTKILKTDIRTCHIPVILLTAKASLEHKLQGLEEGADSYIPKPFNPKHLQIRVKKLIEVRSKIREHFQGHLSFEKAEKSLNSLDRNLMQKINHIIDKQMLNTEFSVEELSHEVALSRVHLYRKIKQLTGLSVSEYIRGIRLKKATELMQGTAKSLSEIAYETGFTSPSYFAKCFKEQFGKTPSEYVEKMRQDGRI